MKQGWKGLGQGTNTLAYHEHSSFTSTNNFITSPLGVNVIKLFPAVIYNIQDKLESLSLESF
jgi:hypothetical protein